MLIQVAGHGIPVVKGLPPLVVTEDDLDGFAEALDDHRAGAAHAALAHEARADCR